jgi:hypothetical protein
MEYMSLLKILILLGIVFNAVLAGVAVDVRDGNNQLVPFVQKEEQRTVVYISLGISILVYSLMNVYM